MRTGGTVLRSLHRFRSTHRSDDIPAFLCEESGASFTGAGRRASNKKVLLIFYFSPPMGTLGDQSTVLIPRSIVRGSLRRPSVDSPSGRPRRPRTPPPDATISFGASAEGQAAGRRSGRSMWVRTRLEAEG